MKCTFREWKKAPGSESAARICPRKSPPKGSIGKTHTQSLQILRQKTLWGPLARPAPFVYFRTLWTETLEFWRLKVPNSRFALHGLALPKFTVCAPSLPLIHGLCAFFQAALDACLDSPLLCQPLSSRFALHGLRAFDICKRPERG